MGDEKQIIPSQETDKPLTPEQVVERQEQTEILVQKLRREKPTDGEIRYSLYDLMKSLKLGYNNEAPDWRSAKPEGTAEPTDQTGLRGRGDIMFGKFKPGHHGQRLWPTLLVIGVIGLIGVVLLLTTL